MKITLKQIESTSLSESSLKKLLKSYGKTEADDTIVTIDNLLKTLDVPDTLWVIDHCIEDKRKIQLMCADFAERVLYIWEDWAKVNAKEYLNAPRKVIELIREGASQEDIRKAATTTAADAAAVAAVTAAAAVTAITDAADAAERVKQKAIILKHFGEK